MRHLGAGKATPPVLLTAMRMLIAVLFLALWSPAGWSAETITRAAKNWQVYFSPHGGCTEAVSDALGKAKSTVLVQAYSFTSAPIAKALVDAHRRGVKVRVLLDRSQRTEKYSSAKFVFNNGLPLLGLVVDLPADLQSGRVSAILCRDLLQLLVGFEMIAQPQPTLSGLEVSFVLECQAHSLELTAGEHLRLGDQRTQVS